ncbi:MAG: BatD family protein [Rhodothermales bacterium]
MLAGSTAARGQAIRVQAFVSENTIGTEEILAYSIQIENASPNDVVRPEAPRTEGLTLLQVMPSSQMSTSIINGQMSQSVSYEWRMRPTREGEAKIDAAVVKVKGENYRTAPISVTVVPQSQRPQTARRNTRTRLIDPFATPSAPDNTPPQSAIGKDDIFIRAIPSARNVYQNEQVNIEYQLFFREGMQLRQSRLADSWDAEGFWREELDVERRPIPQTVVEKGLRYNTIVLKRVAVFPTRSGDLSIDPLKIEAEAFVPHRSANPFDQFFSFSPRYEPVEVSSPPVTIHVEPLPPGAPESFNGAVGSFHIEASVSDNAVEVGEPIEVEVRISGTGNIATLDPPLFTPPGVFEQYDPQIQTSINRTGNRINGTKVLNYVLIPRSNGTFQLPQVEMAYFNTARKQYEKMRPEPVSVRVTGTASAPVAALTSAMGLPVDDIAGILPEASNWSRIARMPLHQNPFVYIALLLPLLGIAGLYVYTKRARQLAGDERLLRNRRAHPLARKHLAGAMALLSRQDSRGFYQEVERAIRSFIGNRLNVAETGLTYSQLENALAEHGASAVLCGQTVQLIQECDRVRFAPIPPNQSEMDTACDRASQLIVQLDTELN